MQAANLFRLLPVLILLVLTSGCGQTPDRPSRPGDQADIARADKLMDAQRFLAAAEIYRQLAARTPAGPQQASYLLQAAEASRAGSDWDGIRAALAQLAPLQLTGDQALERRLLQAEVLLQEMRPTEALNELGAPPDER